jgi:transcriptional regulator NrdR family protein
MAKSVKKRDGRLEEFVPEKVIVSALKSGASVAVARRIAKDVESQVRDETPSTEIRSMVLSRLGREDPVLEQNWRTYDRAVKRRLEPETRMR